MATHVVVRSFPGPGGVLAIGAEVDASSWRTTAQLVRRRYLRPIEQPAVKIQAPRPIQPRPNAAAESRKR
jgi:hypothetical protein